MQNFYEGFLQNTSGGCFWIIWVYSIHARFTEGLLQLLFTFFDWKTSKWAYHLLQFFISSQEHFLKLIQPFFMVQVFQGLGFLGSRFFRVQVQGLGPGFRSSPTLVHIFFYVEKKNVKIKVKCMKFIIHHYTIIN